MTTPNARSAVGIDVQSHQNALGTSGLLHREGIITEELLSNLRSWTSRIRIYKEMANDAVIATLLDSIKLPLLAAEFTVTAASDEAADLELKQFIEANMFTMVRQSWRDHVYDQLDALDFGFAISEIVLEKRGDGLLYLKNLEPRGQETLARWEFDESGNTLAFVQLDPISRAETRIPIDKCIHSAFRRRKGNPEGQSLLRALYWTYIFKRQLEEFEGIGVERDVGNMPVLEHTEDVTLDDDQLRSIDEALVNLRRDQLLALRLPYGLKISSYPGGTLTYDISDIIHRKKIEIFQRGFAQFLTLGTDQVGTQALVQGDIDFFHLGLIAIQADLMEVWNQQLIPYILVANGYDLDTINLPRITWSDPGTTNIRALLEAYKLGWDVGLLDSNDSDKEYMRTVMDLPAISDTGGEGSTGVENPALVIETQTQTSTGGSNGNS